MFHTIKQYFSNPCHFRSSNKAGGGAKERLGDMEDYDTALIFFVNGRKVVEPNPDPEWTLLRYLREKLRLLGAREACGEGGCGACTLMLSKFEVRSGEVINMTINACLTPLCTVHGKAIVTVEGLGNVKNGLHPVQERIAKSHGTQCGFCTPGFVMSMYTLLRNNPEPSEEDMETAFQGNLCRCTGYRPILDGYRSFCKVENCCKKIVGSKSPVCQDPKRRAVSDIIFDPSEFRPYDPSQDPIFPPELKLNYKDYEKPLRFRTDRVCWYRPVSLNSLLNLKSDHQDAQLVGGNNEIRYEINFNGKFFPLYINIPEFIPELGSITVESEALNVGSRVTYAELESYCKLHKEDNALFESLLELMKRFGDCQLRSCATIGGSIATGSIASDSNTFFAAAGSSILATSKGLPVREVKLDQDFFKHGGGTTVQSQEVITALKIPLLAKGECLWTSKVSNRKDVDAAILNSAIKIQLDVETRQIISSKFVFNGMSIDGIAVEDTYSDLINGKIWDADIAKKLSEHPTPGFPEPAEPHISKAFRDSLVRGMLTRFAESVFRWVGGTIATEDNITRQATQLFEIVPEGQPEYDLVGRPIAHLSGAQQATGEAAYLCDIPPYVNELYGAFVLSSRCHAKIRAVDYVAAMAVEGVVKIFDWKSLDSGRNHFEFAGMKDEVVFAENEVNFYGEPVAFVVAESQDIAERAAKGVRVEYEDLPAILSIEDAIKCDSYLDKCGLLHGDSVQGFEQSDKILEGEFRIGGQKHFWMEPNGSIAIPKGDDEIEVIATTQAPKNFQDVLVQCLGLPASKVIVKTRRIGGGFGGKETRPAFISVCTALAAKELNKPVRCMLNRAEDMTLMGGRHPTMCRYKVGYSSAGRILSVQADVYADGGHSFDYSVMFMGALLRAFVTMYKIPNWNLKGYLCRTNTHSNTAFRGFGRPQGSIMIENIIDHVATVLGKVPSDIRLMHFHHEGDVTPYNFVVERTTLQRCWDECLLGSDFEARMEAIKNFNAENRTRKRGIAVVTQSFPIGFPVPYLNQGGALVMIYKDGSVSLNHGGIEMGQGLHTKMMQVASRALGIPISKINHAETSTDKVPNATTSAASMTADLNGPAIMDACGTLIKRLEPYKSKMPNGTWEEWVRAAYFDRVNLSATGFNKLEFPGVSNYLSYGVGCTDVEIDCLTGEHKILRTDIVMDAGESLNPAIDVGQIEGSFVQGCGYVTLEEVLFSPEGKLLASGPGTYKIPAVTDVPRVFNVSLLRGAPNPKAVYSSKAIGEPAFLLSSSVFFAIKDAIRAARKEKSLPLVFQLDSPATVQRIKLAIEGL